MQSQKGVYPVSSREVLSGNNDSLFASWPVSDKDRSILREAAFQRMICIERKRTERSGKPFVLMLVDGGGNCPAEQNGRVLGIIVSTLLASTRETDVTGWYKDNSIVGVMFTELGTVDKSAILGAMFLARVASTLEKSLTPEQFDQLRITFHLFPEDWDSRPQNGSGNPILYPDLLQRANTKRLDRILKRSIDIVGSTLALLLSAPIFLVVAIAIKTTSKGSVLFRQRRIGRYGEPFVFLKFRTMHEENDSSIHQEYVKQLIAGRAQQNSSSRDGQPVYKLTSDSRITRVGRFLRNTSLDEVPQLFNVLTGEMSLVGPRPPIPYEIENYELWHRRRFLEVKPGMTGLWQVSGRSRIKFDDMVRLDLLYARTWSPWQDLKILFRTPFAVLEGAH
jgi:lipopolysaccharide/colanic/teichoic acid biosynthesis glycosyltransferase